MPSMLDYLTKGKRGTSLPEERFALFLVGPPGIGKSTFISNIAVGMTKFETPFNDSNINNTIPTHISSVDWYVEEYAEAKGKSYDQVWKDYVKQATRKNHIATFKAISLNRNVIIDQTNMTINSRAKKLALFPDNYKKIALVFDFGNLSAHEYAKRLYFRNGKQIPIHVIEKMIVTYQAPTYDEGFDTIIGGPLFTSKDAITFINLVKGEYSALNLAKK